MRLMTGSASVLLIGGKGAWAFRVETALTCRGGAFVNDASNQLYAWYTGLPKLPLLLTTDEGAPLDPSKTLEEQGVSDGGVLHVEFRSRYRSLLANWQPRTNAQPADADDANAPAVSRGGAYLGAVSSSSNPSPRARRKRRRPSHDLTLALALPPVPSCLRRLSSWRHPQLWGAVF